MVVGVTAGYEKVLEVNGVGYRAAKSGNKLTLNLGYSHPVEMEDPEGVETVVEGQNKITVKGIDKEKVGQYAAEIRDTVSYTHLDVYKRQHGDRKVPVMQDRDLQELHSGQAVE